MKKLDAESFAAFVASGMNVVEFTADWCVDCRRVEPFLPELEERFSDCLQFGWVDVDESRSIAEKYHVRGVPTFIVFRDGEELGRLPSRDAKTRDQVESFLEKMVE